MNSKRIVLSVLTLVLCGVVAGYAQGPGPEGHGAMMGGPHEHGPMGHMLRDLNLTDAQKQQVKSIMEASKSSMHPLMLQMEQNRLAMLQATSGGAYDQAKVQALAAQQAQLEAAITVQHEALQHQIYTVVLTPEQRTTFDQQRTEQINRITEHIQKMTTANQAAPAQ